jgi:EAL domain-containing protein (putative c-di-GMP-specific phosphodiesterase class I)
LRALGQAVRARAALDLLAQPAEQCLFLNLHTEDLLDSELISNASPLTAHAQRVVLEISERHSLARLPGITERLELLRQLGFRLALDDVGDGYAGLSSFTLLNPEFVKLDLALVRDLHQSALKRRLVRAVIGLCHDTGKLVVAEGVETPGEQAALEALGCDLLQGYLLGKPARELAGDVGRGPA